jgi:CheY-like chemotaxis protein
MNCAPSAISPPSLLIVEDEALIRLGLVMEFESAGFTVIEATNGDEALDILRSGTTVSAVITDLRMPGKIDGSAVVAWMREHRPGVPIVVASGYSSEFDDKPPCDGFAIISKPYDPSDVLAALSRLGI